jgi:hypothetical protein
MRMGILPTMQDDARWLCCKMLGFIKLLYVDGSNDDQPWTMFMFSPVKNGIVTSQNGDVTLNEADLSKSWWERDTNFDPVDTQFVKFDG